MNEQTSLPPEISGFPEKICAWCGEPATEEIVLEPDRYGFHNHLGQKIRYLRKRAVIAQACAVHYKSLKYRDGVQITKTDSK